MNSMLNKNIVDVRGADAFLDQYRQELFNKKPIIGYDEKDIITNSTVINVDSLYEEFPTLLKKLDYGSDSLPDANSLIRPTMPILQSYTHYDELENKCFSILDVSSDSYKREIQKIKFLMGDNFPMLLINTYKFKMMEDFYTLMDIDTNFYNIIYKIFIVTMNSVIGSVEVCESETLPQFDIDVIIKSLRLPPSYEFCKNWMKLHQLSSLFYNINDKMCVLHNNVHHKDRIYILFEFHTKLLVLLKSAYLQY
ncbi:hypothetical protein QKT26_gp30 [Carcinus maenas nudivirus]|uniref:Uncharacterized protein n=1 Tax=Carcinus maenas nudivirus TaxID=2880837 RepID=A0AAE9BZY8_9VIRU|nr:hypothetical protein QKT26_gp30 [Carcinus maenas nudivirus]UBZ25620.1 hypothetical protein CmNV_030 [Carcinus maenas nudivirus]